MIYLEIPILLIVAANLYLTWRKKTMKQEDVDYMVSTAMNSRDTMARYGDATLAIQRAMAEFPAKLQARLEGWGVELPQAVKDALAAELDAQKHAIAQLDMLTATPAELDAILDRLFGPATPAQP